METDRRMDQSPIAAVHFMHSVQGMQRKFNTGWNLTHFICYAVHPEKKQSMIVPC
jgi:hypothetical protein